METMSLEQAVDFLATNCEIVFKPISEEMSRLKSENEELKTGLKTTQEAVDFIVMSQGGI